MKSLLDMTFNGVCVDWAGIHRKLLPEQNAIHAHCSIIHRGNCIRRQLGLRLVTIAHTGHWFVVFSRRAFLTFTTACDEATKASIRDKPICRCVNVFLNLITDFACKAGNDNRFRFICRIIIINGIFFFFFFFTFVSTDRNVESREVMKKSVFIFFFASAFRYVSNDACVPAFCTGLTTTQTHTARENILNSHQTR